MNTKEKIDFIKKSYGNSEDLNTRIIQIGKTDVGVIFMDSSSNTQTISDFIIKPISYIKNDYKLFENIYDKLNNNLFNCQLKTSNNLDDFDYYLSGGYTLVLIKNKVFILETKGNLDRGVTEATSEPILRGPKDSFTESHSKNLGLIRKRIKDKNLWFDNLKIGKRTKTKISIAYLSDVSDDKIIKKIKNILNNIDVDGIIDSGNLREYLNNDKTSFPQVLSTERPDLTCQSILNGKIAIIVENCPFVLILPNVFTDFIHVSEDEYQKSFNISFTRLLKVLALVITLFTPALYIAITTFDQTVVPGKLLISLAVQREGVPFPTFFEIILLMTIFEILRESDIRLPANMGASMSIVGALVLGQAAVDAGIVSPIAVIVIAITSICSLIFNDVDFINGIRTWRLVFILSATLLGIIGLVSATFCFLLKFSSLENFGVSYLSPFSPLDTKAQKNSVIKFPLPKIFKRPKYLKTKDIVRQGETNEK